MQNICTLIQDKGKILHLYQSTLQLRQFRLHYRTKLSRLTFLAEHVAGVGQCSRWHCSNRSVSSRISVTVERTDVSVRCCSMEDALRLARRYWQRSWYGQYSVDVWKLDAVTTAECCRSCSVRALFYCSRSPLLTTQNILAVDGAKIPCAIARGRPSKYAHDGAVSTSAFNVSG